MPTYVPTMPTYVPTMPPYGRGGRGGRGGSRGGGRGGRGRLRASVVERVTRGAPPATSAAARSAGAIGSVDGSGKSQCKSCGGSFNIYHFGSTTYGYRSSEDIRIEGASTVLFFLTFQTRVDRHTTGRMVNSFRPSIAYTRTHACVASSGAMF